MDFFTTCGDEMLGIVFKLCYYNFANVMGENLPSNDIEGQLNQAVHNLLVKIVNAPKKEEQH